MLWPPATLWIIGLWPTQIRWSLETRWPPATLRILDLLSTPASLSCRYFFSGLTAKRHFSISGHSSRSPSRLVTLAPELEHAVAVPPVAPELKLEEAVAATLSMRAVPGVVPEIACATAGAA